jgi:phosphoribosylformylglycinamidine synthase
MAGLLEDAEARGSQWFLEVGDRIALIGPDAVSLGGSEYLWALHGRVAGRLAPLDLDLERAVQGACRAAIEARLVRSAHDCAEGGLAVTVAECCVSGPAPLGAVLELPAGGERDDLALFGEGPSRIVVSVPVSATRAFEALLLEFAVPWRGIGRVGGGRLIVRRGETPVVDLAVERLGHEWRSGFARSVA